MKNPNELVLGSFAGLRFSIMPTAWLGTLLLWLGLSALVFALIRSSPIETIIVGMLAMILHWFSETLHQVGHAVSARATGYPMIGVRYWGVLSSSVYPTDEKNLPAAVHIRRALGGPVASLLVAAFSGLIFLWLNASQANGIPWWLALFCTFENIAVFGLGALLPLGFTDGSTLLRWWGK